MVKTTINRSQNNYKLTFWFESQLYSSRIFTIRAFFRFFYHYANRSIHHLRESLTKNLMESKEHIPCTVDKEELICLVLEYNKIQNYNCPLPSFSIQHQSAIINKTTYLVWVGQMDNSWLKVSQWATSGWLNNTIIK